jgi:hypothetical protein
VNKQLNGPAGRANPSEAGALKHQNKEGTNQSLPKGTPGPKVDFAKIAQRAQEDTAPRKAGALRGQGTGERGITAKQERFAILVAQGSTLSAAYRAAYDAEGMADGSVWTAASVLADVPKVAKRITEEVDRIERERPHDDAASRRLVREYLVSVLSDPSQKTSDRTRAAELLGKVAGVSLFTTTESKPSAKPTNRTEFDALFQQLADLVKGQPIENIEESRFGVGTEEQEEDQLEQEKGVDGPPPAPEPPLGV